MKRLILLICLLIAFAASSAAQITVPVKKAATLPATCDPANVQTLLFFKTGSGNGLYYCSAANTWTQMGGVASLVTGPSSATDRAVALFDGTTGKLIKISGITVAATTNAITGPQSIALSGSTSGAVTIRPPPIAGTNTLTLPAGTTDFSATGGTSQVVKQTTSGGALTVAQLAASDLSNGTTGSGSVVLATSPAITTPAITGLATGSGVATAATASTLVARDGSGNFSAGTITANLTGTASNVTTNANLTGDVTSSGNATTVGKINGTALAGLATGILKNTTTTGVPSIAVAGDFPTLNQNTTGSAATLTTARTINGTSFDGSANITVTAAAGTLTGASLASGVTASSLTSFGTNPTIGLSNGTGLPVSGITASTSTALGVGSVELGHATDTTLARSSAGVLSVEGVVVATISSTNTFTNKRITARIGTTASSATPTPDSDSVDEYTVTALAAAATFGAPTGTPTDGQKLLIRVKDNGTARSLAWNAVYRFSSDLPAPTTTVIGKTFYLLFVWNAADSKWDNLSQLNNF